MTSISTFKYEWKHFIRSPFKVIALLLFIGASIYALHNGSTLYHVQTNEIDKITAEQAEKQAEIIAYFDKGETGPAEQPWVDVTTPFWAIWNTPVHHFKRPSPAMVYSIGQAEQFGFYKRVTFWSNAYDSDLVGEIANAERLQSGTLDFAFIALFLAPLLLLIWLYNIKGAEADRGILPLVLTQAYSGTRWLLARVGFYALLLVGVVLALMVYGALLTDVFADAAAAFWNIAGLLLLYITLWTVVFSLVIHFGKGSSGNTFKMVGLWLLFTFVVPGAVHQWISIQYPANLMTDWIDAQRDEREELWELPDSVFQAELEVLFPEITTSPAKQDPELSNLAMSRSGVALANELMKTSTVTIESSSEAKNSGISSTFWFNPVTFFQNRMNGYAGTHFNDYLTYRQELQAMIDTQIRVMVLDLWAAIEVDKEKYLEYNRQLTWQPSKQL